jgi:hypothetical protein
MRNLKVLKLRLHEFKSCEIDLSNWFEDPFFLLISANKNFSCNIIKILLKSEKNTNNIKFPIIKFPKNSPEFSK